MKLLVITAVSILSLGQLAYGFEGRGSVMAEIQQLRKETQVTQPERNQKNEEKKSCEISCLEDSPHTCSCCEHRKSKKT